MPGATPSILRDHPHERLHVDVITRTERHESIVPYPDYMSASLKTSRRGKRSQGAPPTNRGPWPGTNTTDLLSSPDQPIVLATSGLTENDQRFRTECEAIDGDSLCYDYLRAIAHGGGSTKGALTCGFLKTLPIPVPPIDEQGEIVTVFRSLEAKQVLAARKQAELQDLFRTLLHELMTAKIRVHDLELPFGDRDA